MTGGTSSTPRRAAMTSGAHGHAFGLLLADARAVVIPVCRWRLDATCSRRSAADLTEVAVTTLSEPSPRPWMTAFHARRFAALSVPLPVRPHGRKAERYQATKK